MKRDRPQAASIGLWVDLAGGLLGTSRSLIHPIVDGEDLFSRTEFDDAILEFDALETSATKAGRYQIFNCSCGVPACGGWEAGVAVGHGRDSITWSFDLGHYRFGAGEYRQAVQECRRELRLLESYRAWEGANGEPSGPVVWATECKAYGALAALMDAGANVASIARDPQRSPLVVAILRDDERALELLLASKADLEATTKKGRRLLHLAAMEGAHRCVELLLGRGADVHAADREGWTALDWSLFESHDEVAALLRKRGALCKTDEERLADRFGTP